MKLSELCEGISIAKDVDVKGITNNSNEVKPGYLFIAVKGTRLDGSEFISDAIGRGAVSVISEKEYPKSNGVVFVQVNSTSEILWKLGKKFYGDPSSRLNVIGITGTNGKTTVSYLVRNIFQISGIPTGLLGTINYVIGQRSIPAALTTPDVLKVNQYMSQMIENGCNACVMELSSHALEQGRVEGINFQAGVYTNLGRDHLDYHKTTDSYLAAKAKLFRKLNRNSWAIINVDDPYSGGILQNTLSNVIGYGIKNVSGADIAYKLKAKGISFSNISTKFSISATRPPMCMGERDKLGLEFGEGFSIETKLIGYHNVYNILAAVGTAFSFGISIEAIKEGVLATKEIPGRLEKVDLGQPFKIYIDYAHTPDALENVLNTLRIITEGKIILVFGCGGDRDREKRPLMGRLAGRLSDYTIITSDNPRSEDPEKIISDIEKGFIGDNKKIIQDRKEAIKAAIDICQPGDILIIAGKGHENYQILKHTVVPFSDRVVVEEVLKEYAGSIC